MNKTNDELLQMMYGYAKTLVSWVESGEVTPKTLGSNEIIQAAVVKYLELIGEQAWQLNKRQVVLDGVNLRDMGNMRHRLVHGYDGINWSYVEEATFYDVPDLVARLDTMLGSNESEQAVSSHNEARKAN